jgi:hypothetical protein
LLLYSQYLGALVIACEMAIVLLRLPRFRWRILGFGVAACASNVLWVAAVMYRASISQAYQLPQFQWPSGYDLAWFYLSVFGDGPPIRIRWLCAAVVIVIAAFVRQARRLAIRNDQLTIVTTAFGIPMIAHALSILGPTPVFVSRQMLGAAVAFVAVLALGLAALPRPWSLAASAVFPRLDC